MHKQYTPVLEKIAKYSRVAHLLTGALMVILTISAVVIFILIRTDVTSITFTINFFDSPLDLTKMSPINSTVLLIVSVSLPLFGLYFLRKLLGEFKEHNVFTDQSVRYLRYVSCLLYTSPSPRD